MGLDEFVDGKRPEVKTEVKEEKKNKPSKIPYWWKSYRNYRTTPFAEGIKDVPDKMVDLVLSTLPDGFDVRMTSNTLAECARVLKDGHPAIIFFDDTKLYDMVDNLKLMPCYDFQHLFKWYRNSQANYEGFMLYRRTNVAILLTKGKADPALVNRKIIPADTITGADTRIETVGGFQINQPTELYRLIITAFTKDRNIVLDPWLEDGTTIRVCNIINRLGIGFLNKPEKEDIVKANTTFFTMRIDDNNE